MSVWETFSCKMERSEWSRTRHMTQNDLLRFQYIYIHFVKFLSSAGHPGGRMWPHWGFNITGDRCCAAKPSPDGPTRGLTSIYEACWHNLPLTGFWALLKESVPLKRAWSLVSNYPYVVLFFLPLQGCTLWCFLQSMKRKASFWGFCLLHITHFLIYHEPFDLYRVTGFYSLFQF